MLLLLLLLLDYHRVATNETNICLATLCQSCGCVNNCSSRARLIKCGHKRKHLEMLRSQDRNENVSVSENEEEKPSMTTILCRFVWYTHPPAVQGCDMMVLSCQQRAELKFNFNPCLSIRMSKRFFDCSLADVAQLPLSLKCKCGALVPHQMWQTIRRAQFTKFQMDFVFSVGAENN